ncbi:MAG: putative peptidoglycan glycosyltransferase FtsW [Massilistercora timonensis]|uniref:FtsW/RodA/SpoVE family cell cycle protein n=1 Tax=Massilistercora timonensis TaxID=2086584 RepID=UPI002F99F5A5
MAGTRRRRKENTGPVPVRYYDYSLVAVLVFLVCFGLVMLYSTSAYTALIENEDSMYYFKRQILFCGAGVVIIYVVSRINYHWYIGKAKAIYFFSLFLMFLVKTPLGKEVNGARRWIRLPMGQQFQPSELAKIAVILFIPVLICKMGKEFRSLQGVVKILAWGGVCAAAVLFLTDNLSTAAIVFGITYIVVAVAHPRTKVFLALAGIGVAGLVTFVLAFGSGFASSSDFRLRRLAAWLHPEQYADGQAYQTLQGLYAIGSGGFFGKGLGNSAQKMVIPEVQNDMILTVICEELGVFGVIVVLVLFGMLLYRILFIAQNAPDMYGTLVVMGIFAHITLQVFLNIAVVTNILPNTGVTLPFISYGGTSVLFLMAEMGIVLGVSRTIKLSE